jgi:hypothetical protein
MSTFRLAYFATAPTVRFLRTLERLRLLPKSRRRNITAAVFAQIRPHFESRDIEELGRAARRAQDERWRLIYYDARASTDDRFHTSVIAEQWMLARLELVRAASPIDELMARKRCNAIATFIIDNLASESPEVLELHWPVIGQPGESRVAAVAA